MLHFSTGITENLRETILQRVFAYIEERYSFYKYTDSTDILIITVIEDMLIQLESTKYYLVGDLDYQSKEFGCESNALSSFTYTSLAIELYKDMQRDLKKFDTVRKNKQSYTDFGCTDEDIRVYLLNTIEVVKTYMDKYPLNHTLREELEDLLTIFKISITDIDTHIARFSNLLVYKKYLKEAGVNFLDKKDEKYFYPIIADFFIDYMRITEILNKEQADLKKYTNDYGLFRKRIKKKRLIISKSKYFTTSFSKKNNKSEIKNYILAFYKRKFPSSSLNTVFRKVFNMKTTNNKYREKDMKNYLKKDKQLDIFIMGVHSKYFLY